MTNTYIQDKLDSINIFDYIVFEYGDIDTEKSNEKLKKLLTDYHNHILEKIEMLKRKHYNETAFMNHRNDYNDAHNEVLQSVLSLLQDTNTKE